MSTTPGPDFFAGFDEYCEQNGITDKELPSAFGAYLNQQTGWDGDMRPLPTEERCRPTPQQPASHAQRHLPDPLHSCAAFGVTLGYSGLIGMGFLLFGIVFWGWGR